MKFKRFFRKSFYLFTIFTILFAILTLSNTLKGVTLSAWAGLMIAFLNSLGGVGIICWGSEKSDKQFYGAFFGGMIGRFALIFIILFILIKYFAFNQAVLIVSLILTYFSFLILEIWVLSQLSVLKGKKE